MGLIDAERFHGRSGLRWRSVPRPADTGAHTIVAAIRGGRSLAHAAALHRSRVAGRRVPYSGLAFDDDRARPRRPGVEEALDCCELEVTPEDFLHAASSPDVKILRSAGADATRSFVQRLGSRGQSRMTI